MKKSITCEGTSSKMKGIIGVGAVTITIFACAVSLGAGTATAVPDVVGKRYSDAKASLSAANLTPVVATVVGDRVPRDQCFVVSTSQIAFLDQSGASKHNVVQVNLSCYTKPATASNPGLSAANNAADAEAVRRTSNEETEAWQRSADGQKWCAEAQDEHPDWGHIPWCQAE